MEYGGRDKVRSIYRKNFLVEHNCFTILCPFLHCPPTKWISYTYTCIPSLSEPLPLHTRTLPCPFRVPWHQAELPVLCSSSPLAISFTHGSAYMKIPISQFSHLSHVYPHVYSLHLCLYSCPANRFHLYYFLDYIHSFNTYSRTLLSHKRNEIGLFFSDVDGARVCYAELNNSERGKKYRSILILQKAETTVPSASTSVPCKIFKFVFLNENWAQILMVLVNVYN